MGDLTDAQIRTIRRGLVDFGYRVSEDEVRKEAAALLAGGDPSDIIGMFVEGWLRDAGLLELRRGQ